MYRAYLHPLSDVLQENEQTVLLYTSKLGEADIVSLLVQKWKADVNKADKVCLTCCKCLYKLEFNNDYTSRLRGQR